MLRPQVFEIFKEVDQMLAGGDGGRRELLIELGALAPVTAVYGNADGLDLRAQLPQVAEIELDGFIIVVTHGDQFGSPNPVKLHEAFPHAEIIVFGHSHRPLLELVDKTVTVMNPGGAGAPRFGIPPSVRVLEVEAGGSPPGGVVGAPRGAPL